MPKSVKFAITALVVTAFAVLILLIQAAASQADADHSGPSFDPAAAQQVLDSVPGNTVAVYCAGDRSSCWLEVEVVEPEVIHEDDPGWDCRVHGNRICGPGARP
jgi:hypothetical protein